MTVLFQIVAIIAIAAIAVLTIWGSGVRRQALRRLLLLLFILAAGSSVFFPQAWTVVAKFFGIGRGADLLLYITVITFLGFVASTYRRFQRMERDITELARQLALSTASKGPTPLPEDNGERS